MLVLSEITDFLIAIKNCINSVDIYGSAGQPVVTVHFTNPV